MLHTLKTTQILGISPEQAWEFLSRPENLKKITPPHMGFEMLYRSGSEATYAGQIITYRVRPLLGLPIKWVTEITHVEPGRYFVDEQRFGPYAFWHHQHWIQPHASGTQMVDEVNYKLPFGMLSAWAHPWLVKPQLESIFNYRFKTLEQLFPVKS